MPFTEHHSLSDRHMISNQSFPYCYAQVFFNVLCPIICPCLLFQELCLPRLLFLRHYFLCAFCWNLLTKEYLKPMDVTWTRPRTSQSVLLCCIMAMVIFCHILKHFFAGWNSSNFSADPTSFWAWRGEIQLCDSLCGDSVSVPGREKGLHKLYQIGEKSTHTPCSSKWKPLSELKQYKCHCIKINHYNWSSRRFPPNPAI